MIFEAVLKALNNGLCREIKEVIISLDEESYNTSSFAAMMPAVSERK